jgi:hypothetical protein
METRVGNLVFVYSIIQLPATADQGGRDERLERADCEPSRLSPRQRVSWAESFARASHLTTLLASGTQRLHIIKRH